MESKLRAQVLQSLPKELQDYVISHYAPDCEQVSPTAAIIHKLTFRRSVISFGHTGHTVDTFDRTFVMVMDVMRTFDRRRVLRRWQLSSMFPEEPISTTETRWHLQNQLEQDEIAKAIEPAVAEWHNPFRKLPKPLMDKIRWCALEPTPSAKCMYEVYRVSPSIMEFHCDTWHIQEWPRRELPTIDGCVRGPEFCPRSQEVLIQSFGDSCLSILEASAELGRHPAAQLIHDHFHPLDDAYDSDYNDACDACDSDSDCEYNWRRNVDSDLDVV